MRTAIARYALALVASLECLAPPAAAHDRLGALLNGIADFRRNHEFADVVKQSRKFLKIGQFDDQDAANLAPIGPDGWPTTDFRVLAMAGQQNTQNLAGAYAIAFTGQADLAVGGGGGGTISGKTFDAGTNTTRATLNFPAGAENMIVDFTNTGGAVKNLRIVRPGLDPDAPPLLTPAWTSHAGRFSILRFMDWTRTNGNRHVAWADRTTPEKLRTEAWIAQWETVIDAANALGRDAWINIPVQANDEYVTNLATLVRDRLAPNLAVYVEYGNELWNFSIRDVDLDNAAGDFFNGATVNADLAEASPPDSPLRFDGEGDKFILGFRRVALRLAQVSDIFKAVWGPAAINTRVRPVLAGQMANSFIVSEGLRLIDEGLGRKPDTVIYAISGAPYVFPSAIPDGEADEVPGLTKDQILDGLAAGVANAPNENAYQYLTHAAMAAWYGVKVVAYEFGFDNFGAQNVAAKRAANLDPRIRGICRDFLDQWHAFGFDHALWFSAGADSYDTPFGMWPLVEDMADQATPKNQCMDDILAAPLPAITIGSPVAGGAIAGGSYRGGANPAGPVTGLDGPFGFPGFVEYLLRADDAGAYEIVFTGSAPVGESFRLKLNNATVAANVTLPATPGASVAIPVTLRKGLNALRIERAVGASFSISAFSFTLVGDTTPDPFSFAPKTGVAAGSTVVSDPATITGITAAAAVTVTGGEYSVGCTATFTAAAGTIANGQSVCVRHAAAAGAGAITTTTLTIGGVAASFSSTTAGPATFADKVATMVTGYFQTILGRAPDAGGLAFWSAEAARVAALGADVREVFFAMSMAFFGSPEYALRNRTDTEFLTDMYRTFFLRDPDGPGLAFWQGELTAIGSRSALLNSFLFSAEFSGQMTSVFGATAVRPELDMTVDLFRGVLGRLPDSDGFAFWLGRIRQAQCLGASSVSIEVSDLAALFFQSAEYAARGRTDREFVGDLYNAFLRRGPGGDSSGFNFWVGQVGTQGRDFVRAQFVPSPEFQARVALVIAAGCLP